MKFVEPIRDREKIEEIKKILQEKRDLRNLLMFTAGINFAIRIQDLLKLQVKDVYRDGKVREYFEIIEGKTKKKNRLYMTEGVKKILQDYLLKYPHVCINPDNYIFFKTRDEKIGSSAIGRRQALNVMNKLVESVGLSSEWVGTHSLRKTWAYHARKNDVPLEVIQRKLNHSTLKMTERYLGITNEEVWEACLNLNL